MKKALEITPWFLLYSRLATALLFVVFGFNEHLFYQHQNLTLFLFIFGFVGDIFDGIIARFLKMDTTVMRRLDSLFDLAFWLSSSYLLYISSSKVPNVIIYGIGAIICIVFVEYVISLARFKKAPSSHNFLSKFFGLALFALYVCGFAGYSPIYFGIIVVILGLIARLDSLLIYSILHKWTHDIPSSRHALLINNGIQFRRNKLFHSEQK